MESQKQSLKKKWIIIAISALVVISALIFVLYIFNYKKDLQVVFVDDNKEQIVYSHNEGHYEKFEISGNGKKKLIIKNRIKGIETVTLWVCEGENISESELRFEKNKCVVDLSEYGTGSYDICLGISKTDGTVYYVSNSSVFKQLVNEERIKSQTVIQLTDFCFDNDLIINEPFNWKTNGKKVDVNGNIIFDSETEGVMNIISNSENDIIATHIFCDTPLWIYEMNHLFGEFKEEVFYYINAQSVNGKNIDITKIEINSTEELQRLLQDNVLILKDETKEIIFSGDYDIKNVIINKPVKVTLSGKIEVSECLNFKFIDKGEVSIDTSNNSVSISDKIVFDVPNADIIWDGDDKLSFEYISQYMNVASYNGTGTDKNIAGMGSNRLVLATINGIDVLIDGNYIFVKSSYNQPIFLDSALLNANYSGVGDGKIVENEGKYYLVVTDEKGEEWGYLIKLDTPSYTLPVVYITTTTGTDIVSKEEYITGSFSIDYNGSTDYENIDDALINIRGRGNSSWKLDKKPYKIKFDKKTSLFGLEEAKDWVLLANHIDRSLIRNTVAFEMSKILDNFLFVPSSYPVDVFLNGEYQGVYTLGEQVEMKSGRIEGEADKDSTEVDTDYLIEWGGQGEYTSFGHNRFATDMHMSIEVKVPDASVLTKEQFDYIANYIVETDKAVMALEGYEEYIDIPSLIDWFLIYEFSYNTDGIFRRSDFFMKKQGGKLYAAAPWDFDYAFGNFYMDPYDARGWICLGNANTDAYEGKYIKPNWITYLLEDESFKLKLKERWAEVGEKMYLEALSTVDEMQSKIGLSANENYFLWNNCLGTHLQYESWLTSGLSTYEEQVGFLKEFIEKRYLWMNETINAM